jgi:hypothetical protein
MLVILSKLNCTMGYVSGPSPQCNENPIYVFLEKELRGLSPNFHIHVSVSDLYIPKIGPHIFVEIYKLLKDT